MSTRERIRRAWTALGFAVEGVRWPWPSVPPAGPFDWRADEVGNFGWPMAVWGLPVLVDPSYKGPPQPIEKAEALGIGEG